MTADPQLLLSAAQMEIWLAQALEPQSPIYNVGETVTFPATLDVGCFRRALQQTITETDALHVRFSRSDRGPLQRPGMEPLWSLIEDPAPIATARDLERRLRHELDTPIDIEGDALFRATLLRLSDGGYVWCQIYHHIVMDGFARALFATRVAALYSALTTTGSLPERTFGSFQDLLSCDSTYHESDQGRGDRELWRRELLGFAPAVTPQVGSHVSGFRRQGDHLSVEMTAALRAFSKAESIGIAPILCAIAAVLTARMAAASEAVIGFVVSARSDVTLLTIPGAVSNIVPVRLTINPREGWRDLLARAGDRVRFALEHQRTRLEDMRRDLGLSGAGAELTASMVNVIPFFEPLAFGAITASLRNLSNGPVDDFSIVAYPHRSELRLRLDFNAHAGKRSDHELERFRRRFLALLGSVVADAGTLVGSVDLLLDGERALVLEDWNATAAPIVPLVPAAWFEAQVARTPDALALVCGDGTRGDVRWTYDDLNRRANRIAHTIIAAGLGPEDRVAIVMARSADLVAAQLGVLKSGAAYLPFDASYPAGRIEAVTRDAGVRLALTDAANAERLPSSMNQVRLDADALSPDDRDPAPGTGHHRLTPRSAAYVIYTSGSTGVPKGVLVEQRGVTDLIAWAHETYGDALDRVFVTTSLCFDVSVFEILGPLCRGGRIDVLDNLLSLADHAQDAGPAAMVSGVPSALASLLDHAALPPQLSAVVLAGEALPARLVRRLRAERPGCRISNVYGPTEATVYATAWHAPNEGDEAPPIGRPVRNMQVYVLDAALRPLPPGVTGDLYLAGIGLARGYLDRAGLTAERFVADPHGAPGARMYHTGDRARWRADGMLDYLGRSDHQVKVRGYRIEPGEIEEALVRHAGIADAVVVPRDLGTGLMALVAYVVAKDAAPTPADLRAHLAENLPTT